VEKATGKLIGACGLKFLDGSPEIEIGYHLARAGWNKGYATEAARACLRHAFEWLQLRRLVAVIEPDHVASQRVVEKLSMTYERMGHYYKKDLKMYVALPSSGSA